MNTIFNFVNSVSRELWSLSILDTVALSTILLIGGI